MLFAEAPMIDPGLIIMLLVIVALVAAAAIAVVVTTVIAGYRHGRDRSRKKAEVVWIVGITLEALVALPAYASLEPVWIVLMTIALGLSLGSRWLGASVSPTPSRGSPTDPGAP